MRTVVIIPSRLASTRFPNKPLCKLNGREMVLHVCDRVYQAGYDPYVATPDSGIVELVEKNGYYGIITGACATGTDRVAQAAEAIEADIYVNVQGDEPLIRIEDIETVVKEKIKHYNVVIGSMCRLSRNGPNIVKVMQNAGQLISLTREGTGRFAQCGLYAFNQKELRLFYEVKESEKQESLKRNANIELMRFIEMGYPVKMVEIVGSPAVDTIEDAEYIQGVMRNGRK